MSAARQSKRSPLLNPNWPTETVASLQARGVLLVEDGNHGEYRPRPNEFSPDGVAFIRAADMDDGEVLFESAERINAEARRRVRKGIGAPLDILLSHKGTVGKVAFAPSASPDFVCSPQTTFWRVLNSEVLDRRFLYFYMCGRHFQNQLARRKGETDMADYVSLTAQRELEVPIAPIEEQRAIAAVLGPLQDKIASNRDFSSTLGAIAQSLFRNWFVEFAPVRAKADDRPPTIASDLSQLFPDLIDLESGLPEGWCKRPFDEAFDVVMGQSPPGESYNQSGDGLPFYQGRTDFGFRYPERRLFCSVEGRRAKRGDTLLSVRAPVGDINVSEEDCIVGRGLAAIRHKSGYGSYTFYAMSLLQPKFAAYNDSGTVFGAISKGNLSSIEAIEPMGDVVRAFDEIVAPLDARIGLNVEQSRTLAQLRDLLLPRLLAGTLTLRDAVASEPT